MSKIHHIEPCRVIHELITKSIGTYLIRHWTENDDLISRINTKNNTISNPYVVLSVRVDDNQYHCPIMNYRLPLIGSNDEEILKSALESYSSELPELKQECIIRTEETDWKIGIERIRTEYIPMYSSDYDSLRGDMQCDEINRIKIYRKLMKQNEQELLILQNLSYFHIVTFYGICCEFNQKKYLILADHGESLKKRYPEIKYFGDLMSKQLAMFGYQIACGMMYLESKSIVHRDLHAENILIDDHDCIRITDFEHAIIKNDLQEYEDIGFKKRRLAPECLPLLSEDGELIDSNEILLHEFSSKSDVWAYGLIFIDLTIAVHEHIYPELELLSDDVDETYQLIQYIKIGRKKHRKPDDCPENLYNILKHCWEYERNRRISFENLRHEMMQLFKSILR